ncbi:MAG TPA: hypothetical protein VFU12_18820 [Glycomyces sp.]|nr:hypothetical protein [Glycomyces sp.]
MAFWRSAEHDGEDLYALVWELVCAHGFDTGDFVIAGSGRLWIDGIVHRLSDIDIVARGETWTRAQKLAQSPGHDGLYEGENTGDWVAQLYGKRIDVSEFWVRRRDDSDRLIDDAEVVAGLRHLPLSEIVAYKRELDRPKDRDDLARIARALNRAGRPGAADRGGPPGGSP